MTKSFWEEAVFEPGSSMKSWVSFTLATILGLDACRGKGEQGLTTWREKLAVVKFMLWKCNKIAVTLSHIYTFIFIQFLYKSEYFRKIGNHSCRSCNWIFIFEEWLLLLMMIKTVEQSDFVVTWKNIYDMKFFNKVCHKHSSNVSNDRFEV